MTDVQRLSGFLQVDTAVIEQEQWSQILPALILRATEYEQLKSRTVVLEVEVEQANKQAEKRVAAVKLQLDSTLADLEKERTSTAHSENAAGDIDSRIETLESQKKEMQEQVLDLRTQTQQLTDEKRQALAMVDRQSQNASRFEEEYKSLSVRYHALRKDTTTLESQVHEARSTASNAQFKQQSLEQELKITQKNVDWLTSELATKTSDFATYRKESSALITTLQQESDVAKAQAASLEVTSDSYRHKNDELTSSLEQSLLKIQDLQDQLVTKEESFRSEMATLSKLIELHERSAKDAKNRIQQLERIVESRSSAESSELTKWKHSYQESQSRVEELERSLADLQADLERAHSELAVINERTGMTNGSHGNGLALLSPSARVISKVQNSGMSLTELYSEYLKATQDVEHERRKNDKIQKSFDDLIQELEARAPQIQQQREEYSELQLELASMSESNQDLTRKTEDAERALTVATTRVRDQTTEITLYQQQIADLGRQVQKLLFEIEEQGFRASPLSEAEVTALNRMLEAGSTSDSAVNNLISERLVLFKNIQELQQQNEQQLKVTRQLGAKMEREEEENRQRLASAESGAMREANEVIISLNNEIRSMQTKMESYIRERDMFRKMLTQSGSSQDSPAIHAPEVQAEPDSSVALGDLQAQFDTYKTESSIDQKALSDQLSVVTKERSELHLQIARISSHLELAEERYKMAQGTVDMMRREVEETRKRGSSMQEALSKQDIRTQQIAEELIENKSMLEGLRGENANLKAEKQLWKTIEQRINDELTSLREERNRLNNLVANLQALQSERERSESDTSQRYSKQLESLETELEMTKKRLSEERDEVRRMTLNKDQSSRESQEKIESLLRQVSDAREAHAVASTDKENFKTRVAELEVQLQAAQEKVSIFANHSNNPAVTTEQNLQVDIADLQSALENAKLDLRQAKVHAEKMQAIAASAENALQAMNTTHDEFVSSMEAQAKGKQDEIDNIKQRVQDLLSELASANQELGEIRTVEGEKRQEVVQQVEHLQLRLSALQEIEEKFEMANSYYQQDLRSQAEIAQEAQQNYENELVRHAEAAQSLRTLREDYNELRNEVLTLRGVAEASESRLANETSGWQTQKDLYERELSELRARLSDMQRQNDLLHTQFETFTSQMSHRTTTQSSVSDVAESETDNVQEIIRYLRREKEIVDVSYEVLQQESKRTKQQLAQSNKTLDELQNSLAMERQKTAQVSLNNAEHQDIMSKMNELNIIRESNVVLRAENESNLSKVRSLEATLSEVSKRIEPLEDAVNSLKAESNAKSEEINLLLQDNERWKQRNQSILQKYERIDPAELQELRDKAAGAEAQAKAALTEMEQKLAEKEQAVATLQEQTTAQASRYDSLMQQSRDRIKKERTDAKVALANAKELEGQVASLTAQIDSLKTELETKTATADHAELERTKNEEIQERLANLESQLAEKDVAIQAQTLAAAAELSEAKAALEALTKERDAELASKDTEDASDVSERITQLEAELTESRAELERQKQRFTTLRTAAKKNKDDLQASIATIGELRSELDASKTGQASSEDAETATGTQVAGISEEEVQQRIQDALAQTITEDDVQARIASAMAEQSKNGTVDEPAVQERIDEALARQAEVNETTIQQRIEEAISKAKESAQPETSSTPDVDAKIEEIIKAKDEEAKVKVRNITKERVDQIVEQRLPKKIQAERQAWLKEAEAEKAKAVEDKEAELKRTMETMEADMKEKLRVHGDNVRKESTMRVTLQMKGKDKEIEALKKKVAELTALPKEDETDNGKTPNLFDDISEHSEGENEEAAASGTESPNPITATGPAASAPNGGKFRGRGGKHLRGARRGGLQGTKRSREDNESEQPAKKAA